MPFRYRSLFYIDPFLGAYRLPPLSKNSAFVQADFGGGLNAKLEHREPVGMSVSGFNGSGQCICRKIHYRLEAMLAAAARISKAASTVINRELSAIEAAFRAVFNRVA